MLSDSTILAIWQQSEYDFKQLQEWYDLHKDDQIEVDPEEWTMKLKLIGAMAGLMTFLPGLTRFRVALWLVAPIESSIRQAYRISAARKLASLRKKGLVVISIAGSYGKTSTKHILHHILTAEKKVLVTPKSINTLLGISQVILQDLNEDHQVFIVEFGEYHPEDIPQLTDFIQPDYGILTPVGRQHLDIIGGFANLLKTFSHYISYFKDSDRLLIAEENAQHITLPKLHFYGQKQSSEYHITKAKVSRRGTEFKLHAPELPDGKEVYSPLFGAHQATNTLPSVWLGGKLAIPIEKIVQHIATLPHITRRHEPTFTDNNILILDNSYNSNADSVKASFALLDQLQPSRKLMVTMGFTELGEEATKIHREFGKQLAKEVDYVGLIETPHTKDIVEGFTNAGGKKSHLVIGKTMDEAIQLLGPFMIADSIILLEGGYRELYT